MKSNENMNHHEIDHEVVDASTFATEYYARPSGKEDPFIFE